jgi:RNA polymerase sigma-B factor
MSTSLARDRALLAAYHRTRDAVMREALVRRYLPLARHLARRHHRPGDHLDDLSQVAAIGLLKAIDRFDPTRGTSFSSYATPTITGELKRYFRDSSWAVHVPRGLQELALEVRRVTHALERQNGRSPGTAQIAQWMGLPREQVAAAQEVLQARCGVPFDGLDDDRDDRGRRCHVRWIGGTDDGFRQVEDAATLESLMAGLSGRDRDILRLRFAEDLWQSEIAARLGTSQMQVSRVIRRATERLSVAPGAAALLGEL